MPIERNDARGAYTVYGDIDGELINAIAKSKGLTPEDLTELLRRMAAASRLRRKSGTDPTIESVDELADRWAAEDWKLWSAT